MNVCVYVRWMYAYLNGTKKMFNVNIKIVKCFLAADARHAFISNKRTTENGRV